MRIHSDMELKKMSKQDLRYLLDKFNEKYLSTNTKNELINIIKYKTSLYVNYNKLFNDSIDEVNDTSLTKEQFNIYQSMFLCLMGLDDKNKIMDDLNKKFIPDISKLILGKLSYIDYPKINLKLSLLVGGAGTGKTHLVSNIILKISKLISLQGFNGNIQILAPTNKALKVIRNKIEKNKSIQHGNIYFQTISKFLEQGIEYTSDGKVVYKTKINTDKPLYQQIKYIIIDESSMISKSNWTDLTTHVFNKLKNVKILLIGDECQLPPVNEASSVVFNIQCKKFKLTEIVRTQSKEISNIYEIFRDSVINNEKINTLRDTCKDYKNFKYIKSFKDNILNFDVDNDKIISYSNDSVDKYNEYVRNILFNNPKEEYVDGEKLIFGSSVKMANINGSIVEAKYMYANDESTVINIEKTELNTNFIHRTEIKFNLKHIFPEKKFEVYKLQLSMENGEFIYVYKVQEHDIENFDEYFKDVFDAIKTFSKNRKIQKENISKVWDIYYTVKNTINSPIKYSYALTVYKSQGSTFKKVFVDIEDMNICVKDKSILSKSMYTAITRGSEKIYCYKPNVSDYHTNDLIQFPYLKKYIKLDNLKVYDILKNGKTIIYTRNEYQNKNTRKLVRGKVVNISGKKICIGNGSFTWDLKIKDDILIYL